jgi:hypothetical protein
VASAVLVGDLSNALDICDSHASMQKRLVPPAAHRFDGACLVIPVRHLALSSETRTERLGALLVAAVEVVAELEHV